MLTARESVGAAGLEHVAPLASAQLFVSTNLANVRARHRVTAHGASVELTWTAGGSRPHPFFA